MKLRLDRLGKAVCKGPLIDHGLLMGNPWAIGETRTVDDTVAHQLLAKYPGMFKTMKTADRILEKTKERPKNKVYEDKIQRPKGVK